MSGPPASTHRTQVDDRLRRFLLWLAVAVAAGTVLELWLMEHTGDRVQLVPFVLCGLLCVSTITAMAAPARRVMIVHRLLMAVVAAGSLFGIYEHVEHNFIFEREIRPTAELGFVVWESLRGASPLLGPGVLAVAAALAWAGTYAHPAMQKSRASNDRR